MRFFSFSDTAHGGGLLGSHQMPGQQMSANAPAAGSIFADLQSTGIAGTQRAGDAGDLFSQLGGGGNMSSGGGAWRGLGSSAGMGSSATSSSALSVGGIASELGSIYAPPDPLQRGLGGAGMLSLAGGLGVGGMGVGGMGVGVGAGGGWGGVSADLAGLSLGPPPPQPTVLPTPPMPSFVPAVNGSAAATAGSAGGGGLGGLGGMVGMEGMGGSVGWAGSVVPQITSAPGSAVTRTSGFGALLNPAPPRAPAAVSYDWTVPPLLLAAAGSAPGVQLVEIHKSGPMGISAAALCGNVGGEARLVLQFRESLGASGSGKVAHVRYQVPPNCQVSSLSLSLSLSVCVCVQCNYNTAELPGGVPRRAAAAGERWRDYLTASASMALRGGACLVPQRNCHNRNPPQQRGEAVPRASGHQCLGRVRSTPGAVTIFFYFLAGACGGTGFTRGSYTNTL